ncbi:MAG: serine kinase [Pseudomonadales bacterium]|nr:serine kinase [Pseudomonadales bacterium]
MAQPEVGTEPLATDQKAFFDALSEGYRRALDAAGLVERHYLIAGFRVALRCAGPALLPAVTPAIEHLRTDTLAAPDLVIELFDAHSTGTPLPFLLEFFMRRVQAKWWEYLGSRRELKGLDGTQVRCAFHPGPDILSVLDHASDRALYWVQDAAKIPYYETGYPLTVILNWWLAKRQRQFVHAACIGTATGSVLLTGKGGSGKSTTTLACLNSGLKLGGDDYCVIDTQNMTAHSLYNTIKLKGLADVERFEHLKHCVDNLDQVEDTEDGERALIYLQQHFPEQLMSRSPLRAILVPRIVDRVETSIAPTSSAHAFKALMPSTLFQLPGDARDAFQATARLTRQAPAYEIALGSDIDAIPGVIAAFLRELEEKA